MDSEADARPVEEWLLDLQDRICAALEEQDGARRFREHRCEQTTGGLGRTRILEDGPTIERAAVNFSHTVADRLPEAATRRRPQLVGRGYEAFSISLIVHPRNPHAPTTHANFRFFHSAAAGTDAVWWFGGGFDLTPYYGYEEDAVHWHRTAREACRPFGDEVHARLKEACDRYFFLKHRSRLDYQLFRAVAALASLTRVLNYLLVYALKPGDRPLARNRILGFSRIVRLCFERAPHVMPEDVLASEARRVAALH